MCKGGDRIVRRERIEYGTAGRPTWLDRQERNMLAENFQLQMSRASGKIDGQRAWRQGDRSVDRTKWKRNISATEVEESEARISDP